MRALCGESCRARSEAAARRPPRGGAGRAAADREAPTVHVVHLRLEPRLGAVEGAAALGRKFKVMRIRSCENHTSSA